MPRLSSWFVRASLIYLALGFTLGALLLANKGLEFYPLIWKLLPIHIELLMMGWFVQLAVGVAFWILPRLSGPTPRGNERLVRLAFWLINIGIGMVILEAVTSLPGLLLLGRLAEFGGVIAFVVGSWKRVKTFGR
jgi:heme/copper-type cytochrome/quinol oxidase subunit 1